MSRLLRSTGQSSRDSARHPGSAPPTSGVIDALLTHDDPSIRYRTYVDVLGHSPASPHAHRLRQQIPASPRVRALLSLRGPDGRMTGRVYAKYTGVHWVLADLADIAYPPGDAALRPLRDQVYEYWLSPDHTREFIVQGTANGNKARAGVPIIHGLPRRCASQEGNALYATLALGIADGRAAQLAANLIRWQWPDGGWNCDRNPAAHVSSFYESLIPLRGLAWHAKITGSRASRQAADRAAELFLRRRLYQRLHGGTLISPDFLRFRFPHYWVYDILFALRVMAEAGHLHDPRCRDALDLLQSKALPNGSFRANGRSSILVTTHGHGGSLADWGPVSRTCMNPFITIDALYVLRLAQPSRPQGRTA